MSDSILRIMMSSVMGLRFFNGPFDFFGFSKAINTPLPISTSVLCVSKMLLSISLVIAASSSVPYLIKSQVILSKPGALLLLIF